MIGQQYWSTGIIIRHHLGHQWSVSIDFFDDGFCQPDSTEGRLHTRYLVDDLGRAIDTILADAQKLGIEIKPYLYAYQDGKSTEYPMPDGWLDMLRAQATRIGFTTY